MTGLETMMNWSLIIKKSLINLNFSKIDECPSVLEIFGFIYFYPTSNCGPSFEFSDFRKFINLEKEYKEIPVLRACWAALKEFLSAVILICLYQYGILFFDPYYMTKEEFKVNNYAYKVRQN